MTSQLLFLLLCLLQCCRIFGEGKQILRLTRDTSGSVRVSCGGDVPSKADLWAIEAFWLSSKSASYHLLQLVNQQPIALINGHPQRIQTMPFENGTFSMDSKMDDRCDFSIGGDDAYKEAEVFCRLSFRNQPPMFAHRSFQRKKQNACQMTGSQLRTRDPATSSKSFLSFKRTNEGEPVQVTCGSQASHDDVWAIEATWTSNNKSIRVLHLIAGPPILLVDGNPAHATDLPFASGPFTLSRREANKFEFVIGNEAVRSCAALVQCKVMLFNGTKYVREEIFQPPVAEEFGIKEMKDDDDSSLKPANEDNSRKPANVDNNFKAAYLGSNLKTFHVGSQVELKCRIDRGRPPLPKKAFSLIFNGEKVENATWDGEGLRWTLTVPLNRSHPFFYLQCKCVDRILDEQKFKSIFMYPKLTITPRQSRIAQTTSFPVSCFSEAIPPAPAVLRLVHPNGTLVSITGLNVSLIAPSILYGDYYAFCEARNIVGKTWISRVFSSTYEAPRLKFDPAERLLPPDSDLTVKCIASGRPRPLTRLWVTRAPGRRPRALRGQTGYGSSALLLLRESPIGAYELLCAANNTAEIREMNATFVVRTQANIALSSRLSSSRSVLSCEMALQPMVSSIPHLRISFGMADGQRSVLSIGEEGRHPRAKHAVLLHFHNGPRILGANASCESVPTEKYVLSDKKEVAVATTTWLPQITDLRILCPTCNDSVPAMQPVRVLCRVRFGQDTFPSVTLTYGGKSLSTNSPSFNCTAAANRSQAIRKSDNATGNLVNNCAETDPFGFRWFNFTWEKLRLGAELNAQPLGCKVSNASSAVVLAEKNVTLSVTYAVLSFDRKPNERISNGESVVCKSKANPTGVRLRIEVERGGAAEEEARNPEIATNGAKLVALRVNLRSPEKSEHRSVICRTAGSPEIVEKIKLKVEPAVVLISVKPVSGSRIHSGSHVALHFDGDFKSLSDVRIKAGYEACEISPSNWTKGGTKFKVIALADEEIRCPVDVFLKTDKGQFRRTLFFIILKPKLVQLVISKGSEFNIKCLTNKASDSRLSLSFSSDFFSAVSFLKIKGIDSVLDSDTKRTQRVTSLPLIIRGIKLLLIAENAVKVSIPYKPFYNNLRVTCQEKQALGNRTDTVIERFLSVNFSAAVREPRLRLLAPSALERRENTCRRRKRVNEAVEDRLTLLQCPMRLGNPAQRPFAKIDGIDLGPPEIGAIRLDKFGFPWQNCSWYFRPSRNQSDKYIECGLRSGRSIKRGFHVASSILHLSLSKAASSHGAALFAANCSSVRGDPHMSLAVASPAPHHRLWFNVSWRRDAPLELWSGAPDFVHSVTAAQRGGLRVGFRCDARLHGAILLCTAKGAGHLGLTRHRRLEIEGQ